jgi:hypothetical protein
MAGLAAAVEEDDGRIVGIAERVGGETQSVPSREV